MDVRGIKHAAKMSEWRQRIIACRSSGQTVKCWCEENGVNIKSYYRWERLYMAEASGEATMRNLPQTTQRMQATLIKVEPNTLTCSLPTAGSESASSHTGIIIRYSGAEIELPTGSEMSEVAELVRQLSQP